MTDLLTLDILARLFFAAIFGGAIGLERERIQRPAGLRTNMLVALGAALFTILSTDAFGAAADPSRVAANIIVGIGFLGAGTVIQSRESVTGLTTAAGLWTVAAIGMAAGAGYYLIAGATTLIAIAVLMGLRGVEKHLNR